MDDSGGVRGGEPAGGLRGVIQRLAHGGLELAERLAVDQFRDDEVRASVENGYDVRMIERGDCVGLTLEALSVRAGLQELDRDIA